jgi:hypothetical protein
MRTSLLVSEECPSEVKELCCKSGSVEERAKYLPQAKEENIPFNEIKSTDMQF